MLEKAVVPAGGRGTRVATLRGSLPKECVDIGGVPMIALCLAELALAGLEEVAVVVSPRKPELVALLDDLPSFPRAIVRSLYPAASVDPARERWPNVVCFEQPEPNGVVDALSFARAYIDGDDFALVMPDNLLAGAEPPLAVLAEAYARRRRAYLGVIEISRGEAARAGNVGRVELAPGTGAAREIVALHPKAAGTFRLPAGIERVTRAIGRSIVPATLADPDDPTWPRAGGKELDDTPRLVALARAGALGGVLLSGTLFDLGQPAGVEAARGVVGHHR